jgi:hypothetical protein
MLREGDVARPGDDRLVEPKKVVCPQQTAERARGVAHLGTLNVGFVRSHYNCHDLEWEV